MKKMYLAIFLIILIAAVFAGCLSFSDNLLPEDTTASRENVTSDIAVQPSVPVVPGSTDAVNPAAPSEPASANPTQPAVPPVPAVPQGTNGYDVLRSGTFYMKGYMVESNGVRTPMEIAISPNTVYMLSDFEGADMGILVNGKKIYMIYPKKKAYLELSELLLKTLGQKPEDLMDTESLKLFNGEPLSEARVMGEEEFNGHKCTVYVFDGSGGTEKRIYMDGDQIIRFAEFSNGSFSSAYDFELITAQIPQDKMSPPASFTAYKGLGGMMSFMKLIDGALE